MARRRSGPAIVHFTRAAILRLVVDFFEQIGCPAWKYLEEAHLSPALLEDPAAPVPVRLLHRFLERTSCAEGIDHPGLRVAQSITVDALGPFGELLLRSRNVYRYMRTGCRLIPTFTTNECLWLDFEQGQVRFCHALTDTDQPLEAHLFTLDLTIATLRTVAGEHWVPSEITLPVPSSPGLANISSTFTYARTDPKKRYASFTLPPAFLTLPMQPGVGQKRAGRPAGAGDYKADEPIDFADSIRQLAEVLLHDGHADVQTAAEVSGMSVRTFQRRLAEHGLSFSKLVLESRITLSERWLCEKDRPITDVALALGYNDSANFTRAFRRVNGLSPRAYRTNLG